MGTLKSGKLAPLPSYRFLCLLLCVAIFVSYVPSQEFYCVCWNFSVKHHYFCDCSTVIVSKMYKGPIF